MNGKERILRTLRGEHVDRLPLFPMYDDGYWARAGGCEQWEFTWGSLDKQVAIQCAARDRHPLVDGLQVWAGMNRGFVPNVEVFSQGKDHFLRHTGTGKCEPFDSAPSGDRFPPKAVISYDAEKKVVESIADVDRLIPDPASLDEFLSTPQFVSLKRVVQALGPERFISANNGSFFPALVNWLGGFEQALMATAQDPQLVQAVLSRIEPLFVANIQAAAACGVDAIRIGFFYEGANILSPEVWRRLVKPHHQRLVEAAHQAGILHIIWCLDDCLPLAHDLVDIGTDLVVTEQPRAGYDTDPVALRRAVGERLNLSGWVWELDLLHGDMAALRDTVQRQLVGAAMKGHFVMSTPVLTAEYDPAVIDRFFEKCLNLSYATWH